LIRGRGAQKPRSWALVAIVNQNRHHLFYLAVAAYVIKEGRDRVQKHHDPADR
jgi:hypothetical protein